jgi:spore coat protein CotH
LVANYETKTYLEADLTITDNTGVTTINEVGVRLKGNSSYSHPGNKKAFKIDFNEFISGQNYDGLKKLNFSNGFKDPTLMREKIFLNLCREAGDPAPRANFANVYFNGTLWGFYTAVEQIDDQFLDWRILDDDGNLLYSKNPISFLMK